MKNGHLCHGKKGSDEMKTRGSRNVSIRHLVLKF